MYLWRCGCLSGVRHLDSLVSVNICSSFTPRSNGSLCFVGLWDKVTHRRHDRLLCATARTATAPAVLSWKLLGEAPDNVFCRLCCGDMCIYIHNITWHYITSHHITVPYSTLHCTALHYYIHMCIIYIILYIYIYSVYNATYMRIYIYVIDWN